MTKLNCWLVCVRKYHCFCLIMIRLSRVNNETCIVIFQQVLLSQQLPCSTDQAYPCCTAPCSQTPLFLTLQGFHGSKRNVIATHAAIALHAQVPAHHARVASHATRCPQSCSRASIMHQNGLASSSASIYLLIMPLLLLDSGLPTKGTPYLRRYQHPMQPRISASTTPPITATCIT